MDRTPDNYQMDPDDFGLMIKQARIARQLEVSEAARIAQMSVAQWHKLERGEGGTPRTSTRRKMLAAVGLDREPGPGERPPLSDREVQEQIVRNLADLAKELRALRRVVELLRAEQSGRGRRS